MKCLFLTLSFVVKTEHLVCALSYKKQDESFVAKNGKNSIILSFLWENGIHGLSFLSCFLKIVHRLCCLVLIQLKTNYS